MKVELEFEHHVAEIGIVVVEATYDVQPADSTSKDGKGTQVLESFNVFLDGEKVYVDIPDEVLYSELSTKIRNADINDSFGAEDGEF